MLARFCCALAICSFAAPAVTAATVRFDTNVGTFDMVLNPTDNPNLEGHVDNMLNYVRAGRYDLTVINRAADNFVLQMGGFQAPFLFLPESFNEFPSVASFPPVIVDEDEDGEVDFSTEGLTNTRGTVSLALSNNPNTGTSSFFVNLGDNSSLDADGFIPFAEISNMATIDLIMNLPKESLDNSIPARDIPTLDGNMLVIIEQAFVLSGAQLAAGMPGSDSAGIDSPPPPQDSVGVPEPGTLALVATALVLSAPRRRRG